MAVNIFFLGVSNEKNGWLIMYRKAAGWSDFVHGTNQVGLDGLLCTSTFALL
jgi:hypothetical protein